MISEEMYMVRGDLSDVRKRSDIEKISVRTRGTSDTVNDSYGYSRKMRDRFLLP